VKVIDAAPAQIPAPDSIKRALDVLKSAKRPLIILGKGAAMRRPMTTSARWSKRAAFRSCR